MKLDLKVGMYFRTKEGTINKIDRVTDDKSEFCFDTKPIFSDGECLGSKWGYTKDIIKASDKLIDLIECGDYVNGYKVTGKDNFSIGINLLNEYEQNWEWLCEDEIQSIVTKEQFEQMSYKVGD